MLAAKRLRAHLALFAALFGVVAVVTAFSSGIAGYLATATTTGVRDGFAAASGDEGAVRVEARLAGADQDAAVREIVAERFGDAPMLVDRTVQSDPVGASIDGTELDLVLASLPIQERATLVDGEWAGGPSGAVLHAAAAEALGVEPGDVVSAAGSEFTVTGTWRPLDALDPAWFGEELAATGSAGDVFGPLVIDEGAYGEVSPFARWVIRPDPEAVRPQQLDDIAAGVATLPDVLGESDTVATGNVIFGGRLGALTESLAGSVNALGGVAPVPAILVGAIGLVTLVELARLLVNVRLIESSLLRSRGASAVRIAVSTALEALIVALPAAVVAGILAQLATGSGSWPIAAAIVAATVVIFGGIAFLDARRPPSRETAQDSGRGRQAVGLGVVVLALAAATVSVWQFRLYGSPIVRGADGRSAVDPIAVLAPTLALVAGALLVVVLFAPVSAGLQRSTRRRGGIGLALAASQIARRATVFTTPVLLIALAVGGLVVAGTYSATWDRATAEARDIGNGADVRVVTAEPLPAVEGVDAQAPVFTTMLQSGDDAIELIAIPAAAVATVVNPARGAVDRAAIAAALETELPVILLPPGTTALEVDATGETAIWLVNSQGRVQPLRGEVPEGQWSIAAIDVTVAATGVDYAYRLSAITAVTPEGSQQLELGEWALAPEALEIEAEVSAAAEGIGFDAEVGRPNPGSVRLMPGGAAPVPIVVSQAFADRGGFVPGDELTVRFANSGRDVTGTIAAVEPVIPGTTAAFGMMADLAAFGRQQLVTSATVPEPGEVWIAAADPSAVASGLAGPGIRITTVDSGAGEALLSAGRVALWIGAIGGLVLAAAAVSAVAGALLRGRSGEVVVLRVVGRRPSEQASSRRRELALVVGFAVLGGLAVGAAVSLLTVADLARSAVLDPPAALPTVLGIEAAGFALLGGFVVVLAVSVLLYGARVARQARTLSVREDVR